MKTTTIIASSAIAMAGLLAGCGSKTDANEKNFADAINTYRAKKGPWCLDIGKLPIDVSEDDVRSAKNEPTGKASRMAALEAVGLVKGETVEVMGFGLYGPRPYKVKRYSLTEAAKPFEQPKEFVRPNSIKGMRTNLCWTNMVLDKIVKWEGPRKSGDYQEATVKYHYKLEGLTEWSKNPEVMLSFPVIDYFVKNAGKLPLQAELKLTNIGWELKGLDD